MKKYFLSSHGLKYKIVVSLAQIGQISAVKLKELIVDTILPKFTEIGFDVSGAIIILPMVLYTRRSYAEASYNFKQFYNYARRKNPVKIAFGLANKVLYSSNLDKSNVRLPQLTTVGSHDCIKWSDVMGCRKVVHGLLW